MPNGGRDIVLEGLFAEGVLGIFRAIRGYADLRELAAISVPYTMDAGDPGSRVAGHQRAASERHAEEIKQFLEQSENRFLPEVISVGARTGHPGGGPGRDRSRRARAGGFRVRRHERRW